MDSCDSSGLAWVRLAADAQFAHLVDEWTAGEGMDVILDPVGGSYLGDNLKSLGLGGAAWF